MSQPNILDLIKDMPMEWTAVAEIFQLRNGYTPSKSNKEFWENGTVPWFRMDDIRQNGQILNDSLQKVSENAVKGGKLFPADSIIIATSATIGEHALITVPYLANQRFTCLSVQTKFINHLDMKFVYYYCFLLSDWCKKNTTMSSFASVDMDGFKKFLFPIPYPENPKKSLEIQAKIVRILDTFTELTSELNARTKQYNYYRDQLLSFEENEAEWKPLSEVAEYSKTRISFAEIDEDNYVGVDNLLQNKSGKTKSTRVPVSGNSTQYCENDILIGNIRPYLKKIWQADRIGGTNGDVLVVRLTDKAVNPRYLYQVLADDKFFDYNMQHAKGAKMPRGDKAKIMEYSVPVPPLTEQARIVAILDKFDTLTTSLSEGLPREIQLRQQQYEYYRDLLLSFPKSAIHTANQT
ncbi:MAG: restriction endonuclease subunit S [Pseudomonas sp.]|jgi:type I restriction enzyme S subunit|nr:restriction endonuclease subunit S [Pseudomonas sp.]NLO53100.1 restriction endonuclease subunit S [Gammaproteobacteria bacterium]